MKTNHDINFNKIFKDTANSRQLLFKVYEYLFNQMKIDSGKTPLSTTDSEINKKAR